ncbi:type VI secretion system Vgr family protein [Sorangium sp. So ce1151]|uniref:type VI secretion system Vgr family protein n=1 Tax=Sorangium sp. So ce1151 TaxID=3133332 RepID=UPI003F611451
MNDIDVRLACEPLGDCIVLELLGREAMDALSSWEVVVAIPGEVDLAALLRAPATLAIVDPAEGTTRLARLLVIEASFDLRHGRDRVCALRLSDPPWLLTRRGGYRVFLEKTTEQIVTEVLTGAGIPAAAIEPRLAGAYPLRPQCVQYAEAEWAFVERLLADEGISYWFETTAKGEHLILFGDGTGSHDGIEGGATLPYAGPTGTELSARALFSLEWEERVVTDQVTVRDFDVRHPGVYVDGHAGEGEIGWLEYPAGVTTLEAAKARAERRLEQLQRDRVTVTGESDCARLMPGRIVEIAGAEAELFEQRMLITEVSHRFARPLPDGGRAAPYGNRITLRPTKSSDSGDHPPYRPALRPAPAVEHLDSAVITGPPGEEIHVDDLGRAKVRFLWDRAGIQDDRSSHWTRCLQLPLGASMFLPRVGWEVTVGYLDGSPDRPFVLGRVYNATAVAPYPLPAASATTSFQSWTTPKSGMTQEIKMVDDAGRQEFFVHASRDLSVKVGDSATTQVDGDEEHLVGLSLTSEVLGSHIAGIAAMQTVDVGQEMLLSVEGSSRELIAGAELVNVTGNRAVLADSACVEVIGAQYTLLCNQSNIHTTGACTRVVLGTTSLTGGLGVTESVAAARTYVCRGSRTITCGGYAESVLGGKRSKAGAVNERAAGNAGVNASSGSITAGTVAIHAGGKVSISAPVVTIDVTGSIEAGTLNLGGGKLKTAGSMTEVSGGTTTRSSGGKVGG